MRGYIDFSNVRDTEIRERMYIGKLPVLLGKHEMDLDVDDGRCDQVFLERFRHRGALSIRNSKHSYYGSTTAATPLGIDLRRIPSGAKLVLIAE